VYTIKIILLGTSQEIVTVYFGNKLMKMY
jgi:hypothetical protein